MNSREAAKDCSPGRKPWESAREITKPRRGDRRTLLNVVLAKRAAARYSLIPISPKIQA